MAGDSDLDNWNRHYIIFGVENLSFDNPYVQRRHNLCKLLRMSIKRQDKREKKSEGFGLTVTEAKAAKVPLLVSDLEKVQWKLLKREIRTLL